MEFDMTPVVLNGEKYTCASCYAELKTRHYIRIIKEWEDGTDIAERDYFKLANILTDGKFTSYETTSDNQVTLINLVGWVITEPFEFSQKLPKVLVYKGKAIDIPQNPRELSIGQNIHLRRDFIEKTKHLEENISIATAIYLQPLIDNSLFKLNRAVEIAKELDELPITLIYPIGFFLLKRSLNFGRSSAKTWSLGKISLKQMLKGTWQGLLAWIS